MPQINNTSSHSQSDSLDFSREIISRKQSPFFVPIDLSKEDFSRISKALHQVDIQVEHFDDCLIESLYNPKIASALLKVIDQKEELFSDPERRVKILQALNPHAEDLPVQVYSINTINCNLEKIKIEVAAEAFRNLAKVKNGLHPIVIDAIISGFSDIFEMNKERELSNRKIKPAKELTANCFKVILQKSDLSTKQLGQVVKKAYDFYRTETYPQNPWLDILASHKCEQSKQCLENIASGNVRPKEKTLYQDIGGVVDLAYKYVHMAGFGTCTFNTLTNNILGMGGILIGTIYVTTLLACSSYYKQIKQSKVNLQSKRFEAIEYAKVLLEKYDHQIAESRTAEI